MLFREKKEEEAVFWYKKAAKQDDLIAQYNLGCCYADGIGVKKDCEAASAWFDKARSFSAQINSYRAKRLLYLVAYRYELGDGVRRNEKKAIASFEKACTYQGMRLYDIAELYDYGYYGIRKNKETATYFYQKAAQNGYDKHTDKDKNFLRRLSREIYDSDGRLVTSKPSWAI